MLDHSSRAENTYIIDSASGAEIARLLRQNELMKREIGGFIPFGVDQVGTLNNILDIACGPGGWALDVAFALPEVRVVGIDVDRQMIQYANMRAKQQELNNASFRIMNVLQPLDFSDGSFDLINSRFLSGFMPSTAWSRLIQEYFRIVRSGGVIVLTEMEQNITNSPANERINAMFALAMKTVSYSFSPDGRHIGITPMISSFLQNAGCQSIQKVAQVIDFSFGTEVHESFYQDLMITYQLMKPFLANIGVTRIEEYDSLYQQALIEMKSNDFRGVNFILTTWGVKP